MIACGHGWLRHEGIRSKIAEARVQRRPFLDPGERSSYSKHLLHAPADTRLGHSIVYILGNDAHGTRAKLTLTAVARHGWDELESFSKRSLRDDLLTEEETISGREENAPPFGADLS